MITFKVSDVKPYDAVTRMLKKMNGTAIHTVGQLTKSDKIEAAAANTPTVFTGGANGFASAVNFSYSQHIPLMLSPDDIWLCITQGLAYHINQNAEALRRQFVSHEGKKVIELRRDAFVKGSPDNDWQGCFTEFSAKIKECIGKKHDLIVSDFSTTGTIERAASEVTLMDAMQSYFEYRVMTCCGIPEVTLMGTTDDWNSIKTRAQVFSEFGLDWWMPALNNVLQKFVDASQGDIDLEFWQSMFKESGGSGGTRIGGWITVLFPYLNHSGKIIKNPSAGTWCRGDKSCRIHFDNFTVGLSKAPFTWTYLTQKFDMEFLGGFVGASIDEKTLSIRPSIGWAVGEKK